MKVPALFAIASSIASATVLYGGVNEAGGEFAPTVLPGRFGKDYQFINEDHVDTMLSQGVNTFRLPHLLERMCPLSTGLGSMYNETYFSEYNQAVSYITSRGARVIIDPHNYMRYNGSVIGHDGPSVADFCTFWAEMAGRFKDNSNVIFAIMNEPHDIDTGLLYDSNQAVIHAIRDMGASQLILVPGNGWTSAGGWTGKSGSSQQYAANSDYMGNITDPSNNFAFDMHQYFDSDHSGTHTDCISAQEGVNNLAKATTWLQSVNGKAFLSEFGAGSNDVCVECIENLLDFMNDNDEWIGWTYWAAGPMWSSSYIFSVEPETGVEYENNWLNVLQPRLP
ncbi:hypothetical protein TRVA0_002S01442 [Trichomonascus vanleenenianus]|uniref:glycoside hydrolase family 5 protein n=1 Tax=Trichomonascus vanleenenianus TaxID=2268995 RepID=UPI003ECA1B92